MESLSTRHPNANDAFSFETPIWDRFYRKCRKNLKDSRYYRNIHKSKLI